ncbi:MAG: glycosyltransferase family 2 protein [Anaerolineae bacterium]|nr:glycosyltransferase family 2 protein [Anaerolineae bacterium]
MTLPTITIVTPTYNSERYLEATIQSVLQQNYPALEYIIIDGASSDGTGDIIRRYESHLSYWSSESDNGMYDALQKGFARSTGQIMAWLNSDDMYPSWTLRTVANIFADLPTVDWITSIRPLIWNSDGLAVDAMALQGYSKSGFLRGEHLPHHKGFILEVIQQESTFWRRSLWDSVGATLNTALRYAGDFELWARFYQHSDLVGVRTPLGGFRQHGDQLSQQAPDAYYQEALTALQQHDGKHPSAWYHWKRHTLAPFFRQQLRRLGTTLGICYLTRIAVYNQDNHKWQIRVISI